jgi:hypothetical protein
MSLNKTTVSPNNISPTPTVTPIQNDPQYIRTVMLPNMNLPLSCSHGNLMMSQPNNFQQNSGNQENEENEKLGFGPGFHPRYGFRHGLYGGYGYRGYGRYGRYGFPYGGYGRYGCGSCGLGGYGFPY